MSGEITRIFSDLHLGHKASRIDSVEKLRPLFHGADRVIFNGDTWEELVAPWRQRSADMLADLQDLLKSEGCEAEFLRGNHDPSWPGEAYLNLAEGKIAITHGDALLRAGAPWKREMLANQELIDAMWRDFPEAAHCVEARLELARRIAMELRTEHHPNGRSLFSRVMDAVFPPRRAWEMISAWRFQSAHGANFCETYLPKAEVLIIGHFHYLNIRECRKKTIINTGSFVVPGPAGWVEWNGETLSAGKITQRAGCFLLGKTNWSRSGF